MLSKDAELTNLIETKTIANTMYLDRDALADSQAGSAYFWLLLPCTADDHCSSLTHATHSFNKLTRPADADLARRRRHGRRTTSR